jgi:hypothetical protein
MGNRKMWTEDKQQRLNELQRRAGHGRLSPDDLQALDALIAELDQLECEQLRPAFDQMRREHDTLRADLVRVQEQNSALAVLADRSAALLARAKVQLSSIMEP